MSYKRSKTKRSNSPEVFKNIRSITSIEPKEFDIRPSSIGRHSDKRSLLRSSKEEMPPESIAIVDKIMNVPTKLLFILIFNLKL